ncbi:MAG: minor capsid protein [Tissierellia bacterium]|nr:minor capsid protein [Tissierellia bacterium]
MTYWKTREYESMLKAKELSNEYIQKEINDMYEDLIRNIQSEVQRQVSFFSLKGEINYNEARKLIEKAEIEYYKKKSKEYVKNKDYSDRANREMRLYNVTMRTNRLEYLQELLRLEVLNSGGKLENGLHNHLLTTTIGEMKRQAGILSENIDIDFINTRAKEIVKEDYKGANYSSRIWRDTNVLARRIQNNIETTILQGRSSRDFSKKLMDLVKKDVKHARKAAERLAQTEAGRVWVKGQLASYDKYGYDELEVITEPTACPICKKHDGKIVKTKNAIMGENIPIWHPYCRCSTAAHMDHDELDKELDEIIEEDNSHIDADNKIVNSSQESENNDQKLKYIDAKNIKEANAFAESMGFRADYSGIDIRCANEWNKGLYNMLRDFPEVARQIKFVGSIQKRNQFLKKEIENYYYEKYIDEHIDIVDYLLTGEINEKLIKQAKAEAKKLMKDETKKLRVSKDLTAQSFFARDIKRETNHIWKKYNGITVNKDRCNDYEKITHELQVSSKRGWNPQNCGNLKSIFDHEFAHQIDAFTEFNQTSFANNIYNNMTRNTMRNQLSDYAYGTLKGSKYVAHGNPKEMIAEAWSEYCNNPGCRKFAKEISIELKKSYIKKVQENEENKN